MEVNTNSIFQICKRELRASLIHRASYVTQQDTLIRSFLPTIMLIPPREEDESRDIIHKAATTFWKLNSEHPRVLSFTKERRKLVKEEGKGDLEKVGNTKGCYPHKRIHIQESSEGKKGISVTHWATSVLPKLQHVCPVRLKLALGPPIRWDMNLPVPCRTTALQASPTHLSPQASSKPQEDNDL